MVRQKVRTTKLDSRSTKASGNSRREREVQHCSRLLVSSDSMFSLATIVFFNRYEHICTTSQLLKKLWVFFWQFLVQTEATAMNVTECGQRTFSHAQHLRD